MSYPIVENLLDKSEGSIYKLVTLASRRVKELNAGAGKLIEINPHTKFPLVALEEIRRGKVRVKRNHNLRSEAT